MMSSFNLNRPRTPQIDPATTSGGMSRGGVSVPYGTPIVNTPYSTPGTFNTGSNLYNPPASGMVLGASTGGGGGGGGGGNNNVSTPTGPSAEELAQQQLQKELDAIFNPVFDSLSGQESTLRSNYEPIPGQINEQYDVSKQSLTNQNVAGQRELTNQETAAGGRKEDALTSASRLYNELQRGGQQRFGGASSAGEAFQTLTAVEQQRRQGTIQNAYETAMQQIGTYKSNLQDKFATALADLESQKNTALNEAKANFNTQLQAISTAKNQAQSDKATASLNALQDLRNKVYTINAQNLQYAQQLALNQQTSLKTVDDYINRMNQTVGSTQILALNAGNQMANTAGQTSYGASAPSTTATATPTGQITGGMRYEDGRWVLA